MTTITYRDGVLASDSLGSVAGWREPGPTPKLFRMLDGSVLGVTGDYAIAMRAVRHMQCVSQGPLPSLKESSRVIHLRHDGVITVYEDEGHFENTYQFMAWGSGAPAALAALHMGASAEEAIHIASLVDLGTNGEIVSMRCERKAELHAA